MIAFKCAGTGQLKLLLFKNQPPPPWATAEKLHLHFPEKLKCAQKIAQDHWKVPIAKVRAQTPV